MATAAVRVRHEGMFGPRGWERVSWSGVFAGLVMALATQMLLSVLGMAIGLSSLTPADGVSAGAIGWGAGFWALLTLVTSMAVGGYVAGRFAAGTSGAGGAMNGALVWALAFVLMGYLVVSGFGSLVGGAFGAVGSVAQAAPVETSLDRLEEMARAAGIDVDRLRDQLEQRAGEAAATTRAEAEDVARQATGYTATAAWLLFLASALGLFVAAWCGAHGHRRGLRYVTAAPPEATRRAA